MKKEEYRYGFKNKKIILDQTEKGLSEAIVEEISKKKKEPEWMLKYRQDSYQFFSACPLPAFGPNLNFINFNNYRYYIKSADQVNDWSKVPEEIKDTFDKLGVIEAEEKFLGGISTQYESEVIYHSMMKEVEEKGVIFCDTDSALKKHPELFKRYFGKLVPNKDNKFAALNSAVWSGGSFIYLPKNVKLEKPLHSYFRLNSPDGGQFERTLIIVDDGASLEYIEGCTAPTRTTSSLHAAVVEIFVGIGAKCRYTTIQNWSNNVLNLVTKRSHVAENGTMEWIDGNIGSMINMKYPACILAGRGAKGIAISIAIAKGKQIQDAGTKMIHLAPDTSSMIIAKSIAGGGGTANYRGLVDIGKEAFGAKSHVECETLLLDGYSCSDTYPVNRIKNDQSFLEHEAKVSKVSEEQLFYLMSRGINEKQATAMIILGFIEPFTKELPLEYAVELNQLLKLI